MNFKSLFLSMDGRIGRKSFWIGILILVVVSAVLGRIPILGFLISLALIYPSVAVYGKRLHDMGKSAILVLIPFGAGLIAMILSFVMAGGAMFAMMTNPDDTDAISWGMMAPAMAFLGIAGVISLIFLLWVGLSKGDPGPNKYGAPEGPAAAGAQPAATALSPGDRPAATPGATPSGRAGGDDKPAS